MKDLQYAIPKYIDSEELRNTREKLGLSQRQFANLIGCSKPTIERWESGQGKITGPVVLLLQLMNRIPDFKEEFVIPEKTCPVRIWYMYKQTLCTLIDVDDSLRQVSVRNYTNRVLFRAFGNNETPSYEEYLDFLESRCFPRTLDKMKVVLKELNLPFYDPFMIVEKTEGRMAEDDFWLRIER